MKKKIAKITIIFHKNSKHIGSSKHDFTKTMKFYTNNTKNKLKRIKTNVCMSKPHDKHVPYPSLEN
jgi:hypothetical protein